MHIAKSKKSIWIGHVFYDCNYVTFWKSQALETVKPSVIAQGLWEKRVTFSADLCKAVAAGGKGPEWGWGGGSEVKGGDLLSSDRTESKSLGLSGVWLLQLKFGLYGLWF